VPGHFDRVPTRRATATRCIRGTAHQPSPRCSSTAKPDRQPDLTWASQRQDPRRDRCQAQGREAVQFPKRDITRCSRTRRWKSSIHIGPRPAFNESSFCVTVNGLYKTDLDVLNARIDNPDAKIARGIRGCAAPFSDGRIAHCCICNELPFALVLDNEAPPGWARGDLLALRRDEPPGLRCRAWRAPRPPSQVCHLVIGTR